jgi:hypothetical protein
MVTQNILIKVGAAVQTSFEKIELMDERKKVHPQSVAENNQFIITTISSLYNIIQH